MQKEGLERLLKRDFDCETRQSSTDMVDITLEVNLKQEISDIEATKKLIINPMIVFKTMFASHIRKYKCKVMLTLLTIRSKT